MWLFLGHFSCPAQIQKKDEEAGKEVIPSPSSDQTAFMGFCLEDAWAHVCTTQKVTIPPFRTISIPGNTSVQGHWMQIHMLGEPAQGPQLSVSMVLTATYGEVCLGSFGVPICLRNLIAHFIEVLPKQSIARLFLPIRYCWWLSQWRPWKGLLMAHRRDGSWRH